MKFSEYIQDWADYFFLKDLGRCTEIAKNQREKHQTDTRDRRCIFCGTSAIELAFNCLENKACPQYVGPVTSEIEEALTKKMFAWIES